MHSLVARLRGRTVSQTAITSIQPEEPPPDTLTLPHPFPLASDAQMTMMNRKIHPQVHELLESYSSEGQSNTVQEEQRSGLSPRPLRHSMPTQPKSSAIDVINPPAESRPPSLSESVNIGKGSFARISRRFTSSTPWSTFGRTTTPRFSPPANRRFFFGSADTFAVPRHSQSTTSVTYMPSESLVSVHHQRRESRTSEASTWRTRTPRRRYSLSVINQGRDQASPPTPSSRRTSVKDSATSHSSLSAKSQNISPHTPVIAPPTIPSASSLQQTFGSPSISLSAFMTPATSPIPNTETYHSFNTLTSQSQPALYDLSNTTPPLRHWTSSLHAKTYPPRRRRKTVSGKPDENTAVFPPSSSRRLRSYTSAPAVRRIFQQPPTPKISRRQLSTKPSRRSSADWNARQAIIGVASGAVDDYGWPAQVSRDLIRMSLGDAPPQDGRKGKRPLQEPAKSDIIQRGHNVPHTTEVAGRPCPPLFSPHSLPPTIKGHPESGDKPSGSQDVHDEKPLIHKPGGVVEAHSSMSVRNGVELSTLKEEGDDVRQPVTLPRATTGSRSYRKSILRHSSSLNPEASEAGPSSLPIAPTSTPKASPRPSLRTPARHASEPSLSQVPETPPSNKGKRKAEEIDLTPPDPRISQRATFVIPTDHRRTHHQSEPSRAPSAYQHKRVRLSSQSPTPSPSHSRPGSSQQNGPNVPGTPSRLSGVPPSSPAIRAISRAASARSIQPSVTSAAPPSAAESRRDRRRSLSEISIPIGAIVSPQPPSLSRSSTYHMRDPRRPPRTHATSWIPHRKSEDEESSPLHAWLFYISFILFPLWWVASFLPIPRTRHVGGSDTEKAVPLDDPQIEHDGRSWRFRCRVMACISLLTYVPFIVLVAVFTSR